MNIIEKTQLFSSEKFQKMIKYWKSIFDEEYASVSIFPNSGNGESKRTEVESFKLTNTQYALICEKCKNDITLFTYLYTVYSVLVYKITGENKLLFSSPQLKNTKERYNKLLSIPASIDPGGTFKDLLLKCKDSIGNTYKNNIYPLNEIPEIANRINKDLLEKKLIFFSGLHREQGIKETEGSTNHELSLNLEKLPDTISFEFRFNTARYDKFTIQQLGKMYSWILSQTLNDINVEIKNISLVEGEKIPRVVKEESNESNIVTIFEDQVKLYPGKTSVVCPTDMSNIFSTYEISDTPGSLESTSFIYNRYTHKELNEKANQLAHSLSKKGVKENDIVALALTPSFEMVVSILAVLKAGGAFLPIDPDSPVNRVGFMLVDSKCKILVTHDYLADQFPFDGETIDIDSIDLSGEAVTNPGVKISQDQLVYMIYTSGTSGQPKGVMLKHENISNYTNWFRNTYKTNQEEKTALLSSYAFDLGYTALFTSILSGAEIHLIPKDIYTSMTLLINYIKNEALTYLKLTPSLFSVMLESEEFNSSNLSSLKNVLLGGEKIRIKDVEKAYKICENLLITNHYGPTEATIGCIAKQIKRSEIEELNSTKYNNSIIGQPIRNTQVHILNHENHVLPGGLPGEICISGKGLAKAYLNQEELTRERFIELNNNPPLRVYKTGDLGRKLADGNIEFIGRIDTQLKVNGYRIELQEVEKSLNKLDLIDQAVVIPKKDKDQNTVLYAYYKNKLHPSAGEIKNQKKLSEHIIDKAGNNQEIDYTKIEELINNKSIKNNGETISREEVDQITSRLANEILGKYNETYSLTLREKTRYKRQMLLQDWGLQGQEKLKSTKVFVAGAGGGASPTVIQMALAGFGTIVICDFDTVELSNLNRQVLHNESRIGMNKAMSAKLTIKDINPNVNVIPVTEKLTKENVYEMVGDCDMIFDMFDGQQDKFLLSECAIAKGIPHFISAMTDINSYASIFHSPHTPCFSCLFDREKLDTLISGMKDTVDDYEKDPLAVVATSLFQSSSIAVNEAIKYVLYPDKVAYNKYFYVNQKGSKEIINSPSYQSMIFAYSDHFLDECKQQGFDWQNEGWRGKYLEELEISKNKDCKICYPQNGLPAFRINIDDKNTNSKQTSLKEQVKKSGSIAILTDNIKDIAISLISTLKINIPLILLDKNNDRRELYKDLDNSNSRVLLTSNENLGFSEELVNTFNKNIAIINIDNISSQEPVEKIPFKWNPSITAYYKNPGKEITDINECKEELKDVVFFLQDWSKQNAKQPATYLDRIGIAKNEKLLLTLYGKLLEERDVIDISGLETPVGNIEDRIKDELTKELPNYMIPTHLVELDSIPLTANGKVDLKALADLELKVDEKIEKPRNKIEEVLCKIWSEVLGIEQVGINQNFFEIGGDSIKAIQISARVQKQGFKLVMADLFKYRKISELSAHVNKTEKKIDQGIVTGEIMLSPVQYYFLNDETDQHHYNQSVMLYSEKYLEEEKIQSVFRKLQEHHDALRITCKVDNTKKVTGLYNNGIDDFSVSLEVYDLREEKGASEKITIYADQIQRSIDLETGPLTKLGLFHLTDGDRLLIVIHHLVIDGISWRIIFEDLETLFNQLNNGKKLALPLKSNSFREWSAKLTDYSKSSAFLKEKPYWENIVRKEELSLNRQGNNEKIEDNDIGHKQFTLGQTATKDLLTNTNDVYGTEINDILLCGLGYGIKKTLGNEKVLISLEGHGREDIFPGLDISRTIGWFTSVYPVLLDMEYIDDLSLQIRSVKEHLRKIPNKGIGFGILKYLTPQELKDGENYDIEPQIEFNYLGQFDSDVDQMSLFKIAEESGGDTISPKRKNKYDFSIGGMIRNGELSLTISYKKKYYSDEIVTNLLENYKKSLLDILNHCTKLTEKILTPSDFTYKDLSIKEVDGLAKKYEIEDIYKLTPMQEGMLFHAIHDSESFAYFEQLNYRIESELSVDLMRKSLNELFSRYDILRTVFIYEGIQIPLQLVLKDRECEFEYKDIRNLSTEEKQEYILEYKKADKARGFQLDHDVLMRVSLLQLNKNEYELIWSNHHILMDGWCLSIINNDFFEIYNSLLNNRTIKLKSITPYKEYVKWLDGIDKKASLKYWKEYLTGYEEQALLPKLPEKGKEFVQKGEHLELSKEVSAKFQKIAADNNVTANIILQSVWAIVLGRYSNKGDVVFGSVVSGRPAEVYGVESMVGLFINNIPVRIQFSQDLEFSTLIKRVQNSNLESETHHYVTLAEIQSQSILKQNLIDHIIVFENFPIAEKMESLDQDNEQLNIQISGVDTFEQTNYNLTISASLSDVLKVNFMYNANMFDSGMMKSLKIHFENVINHIVSDSEIKISAIDILTEEEKHQLLYEFNNTKADYPKDKTIHQLFEEQVEKCPDKLVLECKNKTFTYQELNYEANKVANCLRKRNIINDQLVGLMVNRSSEMIIGIIGILKSGGAYVPIDPENPKERINHLLKDSEVKILLSAKGFEKSYDFSGEIILLDGAAVNKSSINFNISKNTSNNLAYVMYTSGSTGLPKGVEIEHKSVVRLVKNTNYIQFSQEHKILQTGAPVFDATTFEIWGAILNGGCLYIPDNDTIMNAELFGKCVKENSITTVWLTSSLFNLLADQDVNAFNSLSYLLVGGDILSPRYINKVREVNEKLVLINGYGPTENTTFSTTFNIDKEYESNIPIGKPISNSTAYIFDKSNRLQAVGVPGELLVGGDGLAREYLKNPELTREKFIENPYKEGERLYRTGDLARWLPDGNIEFLGRIDHQVKIRGFRIELGEIENVLEKHELIKESVVLAIEENGEKYLCAYIVTKGGFNEEETRAYLSESQPDYMIPGYFMELEKIPLNSNGKVNRNALPTPEVKAGGDYVAPSNETEEKLVEIWSEVLNIAKEEISTTSNFFAIGGHSLKATILIGRIHKETGVEFPLRDVFVHTSIQAQASQIDISIKKSFVTIPKAIVQDYYPLSSAQKRLFLLQQMDLSSTAYNMPYIIPLGVEKEKEKIEEVFRQLINRHESFRTSFEIINEEPVQRIHESVEFKLEEFYIEKEEVQEKRQQFIQAFDLSKAPLLRVANVNIKGEDSLLMVDMHHIISDGVSHAILGHDFQKLYSGEELAPLRLQYRDYSQWQNSEAQQAKVKKQEDYWKRKFEEEIPVLKLPVDYARPTIQSHEGASVNFTLSKEETRQIKSLAKENDLTLYMTILSTFSILLSKLSGQEDVIVGMPIAGRKHSDLENIVGMFVNTLAIRNEVRGSNTLKEFFRKLKQNTLEAFENQDYQFEDLVENISIERDASRNPVFDVVFNLLNQTEYNFDLAGLDNQNYIHTSGISKFDLTLTAVDYGEQLMLSLEYCTKLFKASTIERYIGYFKQVVNQLTTSHERELSAIEIISTEEKRQLLHDFNDIKTDYPKEKTIYELFEDQVEKNPDNIALVYDDKNLTFDQLNKYANHYALHLLDQGAESGEIIGIMQERSLNMIIGILATLKAGCAYCPINPDTPTKRTLFILKECNIKILISDQEFVEEDPGLSHVNRIKLSSGRINNTEPGQEQELQARRGKDISSAYIIFTSGSTGNPKGVLINHSNIFPLLHWGFNYLRLGNHDKVIQNLAFYFDWSVWEIFISLTSGSSLEMVSRETILDEEQYNHLINKKCISTIHITPTQFQSLTSNNRKLGTIKHLCIGAEKLTLNLVQRSYELVSNECTVYNMYGPTEATIMSAVLTIRKNKESTYESLSSIPIGTPIAKGSLLVLDQYMQVQPVNIAGELYISGEGLSTGYINDPEKTNKSFIKNIYKQEGINGDYLYKTGDLARWLPDGTVEFLGRIDHQVKIRGFRIELGEIENALHKHENIKDSVVIDIEEIGEKYLCAYLVKRGEFNEEETRAYLSESLPDYMVPSYFVELEKIPLNSNGKVNRKALPSPEIKAGGDYVAPSSETEEKLVEIWSGVLNIEKEEISTTASFFAIGGHSLKASLLTGRIHKELGVEFPLRDVFLHTSIQAQAIQIEKSTKKDFVSIPKAKEQEYYPLSPAQKRLYLLQEMELESTAYNMPNIIPLGTGAVKEKIEEAFQQLIKRHESFRTSFEIINEEPVQRIHESVEFKLEELTVEKEEVQNQRQQFIQPFDLCKAPLLRVALVNIKDEGSLLMVDMHHTISDGVSHIILEKDFQGLYLGEELAPLSLQYKDYSQWQISEAQQAKVKKQEDYWIEKFEEEIPVLNLPVDYVRPAVQAHEGATVNFTLSKEETRQIKSLARENDLTVYMSILSALNILLSKLSGQEDIIVGTPVAGRNHSDLENIVGMFVNTLALRNEVKGSSTIKEFAGKLKQATLEAFENQDYQFEELVEKVSIERDISRNPLFDVMFSYQDQASARVDLGEQESGQYDHSPGISKFDLTLSAVDYGEQLMLSFEYCTKLFKAVTIERFIGYFKQVVNQLGTSHEQELSAIEIISTEEKRQLLHEFNDIKIDYPGEKTIYELFEDQVKKSPGSIALSHGDTSLSYDQLNHYANHYALHLLDQGAESGEIVGIMQERSLNMIIGIIAILKAGCAYCPINPDTPTKRTRFILKECNIKILISDLEFVEKDPGLSHVNRIKLSSSRINNTEPGQEQELQARRGKDISSAYIIFTSGSTGNPKGVLINHSNISPLLHWGFNYLRLGKHDKVIQNLAFYFDWSVWEIFISLTSGSSLEMVSRETILDEEQYNHLINKKCISTIHITPTQFQSLTSNNRKLGTIKHLCIGAEKLTLNLVQRSYEVVSNECTVYNMYGPTEATIMSAVLTINKSEEETYQALSSIPIGTPIAKGSLLVLDQYMQVQPVNIAGELYISGEGLSTGYINDPEKTNKSFIKNIYKQEGINGDYLYKTGDLARWLPDGTVEFLGRIDHQVKIRGFRIELGEIENALQKHYSVKDAVVIDIEDNEEKHLCAYIVAEKDFNEEETRAFLSESLPDYMIPGYFMELEKIPLNSNGKVNRKSLPSPEIKAGGDYVAPCNATEEKLVEIWSEVLNIAQEEISTTANFFSVGGHSLKASVLTGRIHKELGVEFPLRDVFIHTTIRDQALRVLKGEKKSFATIPKAKEKGSYPLSPAQKRMYLLQQIDLNSVVYNMLYTIPLGEGTVKEKVEKAFQQLIKRHESFRTSFVIEGAEPVQRIHGEVEFKLEEFTIKKEEVQEKRQQFIQAFDLSQAPLLRVAKVDIKGEGSLLMIDMHHIISDGVSHAILEQDFQRLYSGEELPPLSLQYKDYSEWQNSEAQQAKVKEQEVYWGRKFEGEIPVLNLPVDYVRPAIQSHEGASVSFVISKEETRHIKTQAKESGLTPYMSILSIFNILLSKLSGQEDIIVGTPVAGRNHGDLENIVGMFVNTLAIRNNLVGSQTLQDYLQELKQNTLEAFENQDYQFEELVENISIERDISRNPLFDAMFSFHNQAGTRVDLSDLESNQYVHSPGLSKFDLTLTAVDYGEQLMLSFEYCTKLFKAETIERFIRYLKEIVIQIPQNPGVELSAIEIISTEEKRQLLHEFNDIKIDYPGEKTIYELFEDQVEKSPEAIALVHGDNSLSYDQLNKYANLYALHLLDQGAENGEIIGIMQERSPNMIIGILATLKAGCAYCPINPDTPVKRTQFILKECNIKILISDLEFVEKDPGHSHINCINLNNGRINNMPPGQEQELQARRSKDITSAYIIFTSGSTGNPKGVLINHSNIFPLLYWGFNYIGLGKHDKVIQNLAFYFDWSVWEIFISLTSGSSLELVSRETILDDEKYNLEINKRCITALHITPTQFQSLTSNNKKLNAVRHLCIGAEKLTLNIVQRSYEVVSKECTVYNMYGPTEATIMSAVLTIRKNKESTYESLSSIPIGTPIAKGGLLILDQYMQVQPINIAGELYISGEGLSKGYLNDPEKTGKSFIKNIYKLEGIEGDYLYKTGDLARWLPDGTVEFLGRIDHQVKIRGFRIELGEIENALHKHENIKDSVVIDLEEGGEKYLCAYLVTRGEFNEEETRAYLSESLPDYMVPSYFVKLEKIPLNSNGKVNRKALPSPEVRAGGDYIAPGNATEEKLVEIWSEVLNIAQEEISTAANFFSVGGHSLKASVLTGRIHKELGVEFPLRDVFIHTTIRDQALRVLKGEKKSFATIPKAKEKGSYPLSPAQKRMYLLQQIDLNSVVYNMPYTIPLGAGTVKEKVEKAFQQLIKRHESFRTSFVIEGAEPVQRIHGEVEFKLEEFTIEKEEVQEIREQFIQAFDLSQAPLLRVAIVGIKGGNSLLMVDMHHIISDGVSHTILEQDFQKLYSGGGLAPLSLQYRDYSEWQNSEEQQAKVKRQEEYWVNKFGEEIPVLDLPTDYVRPVVQSHEGATVSFAISKEETRQIKSLAKENDLTLYMSVLSVFNILLSRLSGQEDIVVGTPVAGRNHGDLENIVGMFVNTLAIRNEVNGSLTLKEFLGKLKQATLEAYENQDYQFEELVEKVSIARDISRNPLFDAMFNLLNHADYTGDLTALSTEQYVHTPGISKFDLALTTVDYGDQLLFNLTYCTKLFSPDTIERFIRYFKQIINQLQGKQDEKLLSIEIITESEKQRLLHEFNDTEVGYPKDKTIHQLFEEQVERTPRNIALVFKNTELTYQELNQRSNQLSHFLISKGLKPGNIANIMLDRSVEMIVGILAVLKAGGAYCPIDINNPEERKKYILEDSGSSLLITRNSLLGDLDYGGEIVYADDFVILPNSEESTRVQCTSKDLSYIIYTSGTTGKPKGVMIRHDGVVNTIIWYAQRYNLIPGKRLLQLSNYSFDASVNQVFGTLTGGASLYIIEESVLLDLSTLYSYLGTQKITVINTVPAILEELISNRQRLPHLQRIISGGENLSNRLKDKIIDLGYELHNHYGPTEGTIVVLAEKCSGKDVTLGKPKQNTQSYILSVSNDQLQPIGVKGELCISGEGISPGYLNNEALTKEKFVAHPFKEGERLYRTGDLARWLPDGNIEFLGRIDHQVKIRGFRIELGEIENVLQKHDQVKENVVLAREDRGDKYLCAYLVTGEEYNEEEIRSYLSESLPNYMVPSYLVQLEKLPRTSNGKVNRKILPSLEIKAGGDYVAPTNAIEEKLVEIWAEILSIEKEEISTTVNFFSIGGHSLKAVILASRVHALFNVEITIKEIFSSPTIKGISNIIEASELKRLEEEIEDLDYENIRI